MKDQVTTTSIALKYGVISAGLLFAIGLIIQYLGLSQSQGASMASWLAFIGLLVLAIREFKAANEGFMSFKQGLGLGMLNSVVAGTLGGALSAFYIAFIDDSSIQNALDLVREQLEANPQITDEFIEQTMKFTEMTTSPLGIFIISAFSYLLLGFVVSLILSAIMKNDNPVFDDVIDD